MRERGSQHEVENGFRAGKSNDTSPKLSLFFQWFGFGIMLRLACCFNFPIPIQWDAFGENLLAKRERYQLLSMILLWIPTTTEN